MHDTVPTMKIWTANGPVTINVSDFDANVHTPAAADETGPAEGTQANLSLSGAHTHGVTDPAHTHITDLTQQDGSHTHGVTDPGHSHTITDPNAPVTPPAVVQPVAAPVVPPATLLVSKIGKKFHVVDKDGAAVVRDGIENDGYKTENEAWSAIMALAPAV